MQKTISMPAMLVLIAASIAGASVAAHAATVYRCTGKDGGVAFQDQPCGGGTAQSIRDVVSTDPPVDATADDTVKKSRSSGRAAFVARSETSRRVRTTEPQSWECRTASGLVFYRHSRCPASMVDASTGGSKSRRVTVSAQSIDRREGCRRMRNRARDGSELDDRVSAYERNLGRDTCGRD